MALVKFELAFAAIMGIRKHMVMRLDCEISSAIFSCGLTGYVAWPSGCGLDIRSALVIFSNIFRFRFIL